MRRIGTVPVDDAVGRHYSSTMEMACFGHCRTDCSTLVAQLVGRLFLKDVEEVVVAYLEHLRRDPHANRVALTDVEVDDDLPGHHASQLDS